MKQRQKEILKILLTTCCIFAVIIVLYLIVNMLFYTAKKTGSEKKPEIQKNDQTIYNDKYVQDQVMDYLENRYNETFSMKSYESHLNDPGKKYIVMKAWTSDTLSWHDKNEFEVWGYLNDQGTLDYFDSYVYLGLKKDMTSLLEVQCISNYFNKWFSCDVKFDYANDHKHNLPPDITASEFLEINKSQDYAKIHLSLHFQMEPPEDFKDDILDSLAQSLQEYQFYGTFEFHLSGINETMPRKTYIYEISDKEILMSERKSNETEKR